MDLYALPAYQRNTLRNLARAGERTTALASDHSAFYSLITDGYVTASEPLEAVRQAAGKVPGVRVASGTVSITYSLTPEGRALVEAAAL